MVSNRDVVYRTNLISPNVSSTVAAIFSFGTNHVHLWHLSAVGYLEVRSHNKAP